ncbi:DUF3027 domain-containing protein [Nakamurella multipartita]|uniref:DUF3027 domain-containing protein n=1 Tax=Nakamurella multipartita TaxID=53461 RepID=UPI001C25EA0F|nr:DUF3027 domain-containing protein [Nakamurella multipartita]
MSFVAVEEVAVGDSATDAGAPAGESGEPNAVVVLSDELIAMARAAAVEEAGIEAAVGDYLGARAEDAVATSASFATTDRGYRGWYWLVTIAVVEATHPTISEVVLLPGEGALLAPAWVPWDQRVRAGDLGVGDLLPTTPEDDRLVPGYLDSDDPAVREVEYEFGFGRVRVLGRLGRDDAATRWHDGPFGPGEPMAQQAPAACGTCGFYIRLEGLLGQAFGACTNEFSPADGRVVDAAYGCGAHSETVVDAPMISATTAVVMDELTLEVHARPGVEEAPAAPEATTVEPAEDSTAEGSTAEDSTAEDSTVEGSTVEVTAEVVTDEVDAGTAVEESAAVELVEVVEAVETVIAEPAFVETASVEPATAEPATEGPASAETVESSEVTVHSADAVVLEPAEPPAAGS